MDRFVIVALTLALGSSVGCSLSRSVIGSSPGDVDAAPNTRDGGITIDGGRDGGTDAGMDAFVPGDTGIVTPDTGMDAYVAPNDAYTPPDAYVTPDAYSPPDAYVTPDAYSPPDAYVAPDAYVTPDAYVPPDAYIDQAMCDAAFDGASGYHYCASSAMGCGFYVSYGTFDTGSCADACGTRCLGAIGNADFTRCTPTGSLFPCSQTFHDAICYCLP